MNNDTTIYKNKKITVLEEHIKYYQKSLVGKTFSIEPFTTDISKPKSYFAKEFAHKEVEYNSISDLYKIVDELQDKAIVLTRGSTTVPYDSSKKYPFYHRTQDTLKDEPTDWLVFDADAIKFDHIEDHNRVESIEYYCSIAAIEHYIKTYLPQCFHDVSYVYHFSSSAGLYYKEAAKPGFNCHIFFLTSKSYTCSELKRFLKPNSVHKGEKIIDLAMYSEVQALSIHKPIIDDDRIQNYFNDKNRVGLVIKDNELVNLPEIPEEEIIEPKVYEHSDDDTINIINALSPYVFKKNNKTTNLVGAREKTKGGYYYFNNNPHVIHHHNHGSVSSSCWLLDQYNIEFKYNKTHNSNNKTDNLNYYKHSDGDLQKLRDKQKELILENYDDNLVLLANPGVGKSIGLPTSHKKLLYTRLSNENVVKLANDLKEFYQDKFVLPIYSFKKVFKDNFTGYSIVEDRIQDDLFANPIVDYKATFDGMSDTDMAKAIDLYMAFMEDKSDTHINKADIVVCTTTMLGSIQAKTRLYPDEHARKYKDNEHVPTSIKAIKAANKTILKNLKDYVSAKQKKQILKYINDLYDEIVLSSKVKDNVVLNDLYDEIVLSPITIDQLDYHMITIIVNFTGEYNYYLFQYLSELIHNKKRLMFLERRRELYKKDHTYYEKEETIDSLLALEKKRTKVSNTPGLQPKSINELTMRLIKSNMDNYEISCISRDFRVVIDDLTGNDASYYKQYEYGDELIADKQNEKTNAHNAANQKLKDKLENSVFKEMVNLKDRNYVSGEMFRGRILWNKRNFLINKEFKHIFTAAEQIQYEQIKQLTKRCDMSITTIDLREYEKIDNMVLLYSDITRSEHDGMIYPIVNYIKRKYNLDAEFIGDGVGSDINLTTVAGVNDLAEKNIIFKLSRYHHDKIIGISASIHDKEIIASKDNHSLVALERDLVLKKAAGDITQIVGRNCGWRDKGVGAYSVGIVDTYYRDHNIENAKFLKYKSNMDLSNAPDWIKELNSCILDPDQWFNIRRYKADQFIADCRLFEGDGINYKRLMRTFKAVSGLSNTAKKKAVIIVLSKLIFKIKKLTLFLDELYTTAHAKGELSSMNNIEVNLDEISNHLKNNDEYINKIIIDYKALLKGVGINVYRKKVGDTKQVDGKRVDKRQWVNYFYLNKKHMDQLKSITDKLKV